MTDDRTPPVDNVITHPASAGLPESWGGQPAASPSSRETLDQLAEDYCVARAAREAADDAAKACLDKEVITELALFDAMERQNLRSFHHKVYGALSLNDLAWASIADPEAARGWAENQMPELLTLNIQKLSVVVREHLKGERPAMPDGVTFRTSRKIKWRRG